MDAALDKKPASGGLEAEIANRRTFAIISHPDAGKTTLTEKILYFGGAIRLAGQVRARGERRRTQSDWMAIEQQRGISVTSSVMTFERDGVTFNLLDTPGHEDFSEDTYRTLTAVDSAVMVIDAAKGIEAQTLKLFEVCRLRDVPIITYINKVDREGRDPFELMDEISEKLALDVSPVTWPVGMGTQFKGCFNLRDNTFLKPSREGAGGFEEEIRVNGVMDPKVAELVGDETLLETFRSEADLATSACSPMDIEAYREGHLTPVFFGSALRDFCVSDLLDGLAAFAPPPRMQPAEPEPVDPAEEKVTAFVFKVQANMDPNHRDRIAFTRICSGRFKRGMRLNQIGTGKTMAIQAPIFFFAQDRDIAEEAYPGDILGIPNHGTLRVGDTLSERTDVKVTGLPRFAPEIMRRVRTGDPMKVKQVRRALHDLSEEGLAQVFKTRFGSDWIVGVVGALQLDVMADRFKAEYKVEIGFEASPYSAARWIHGPKDKVEEFIAKNSAQIGDDNDDSPVYLAKSAWELNYTAERWPDLTFGQTKELV